MQIGDFQAFLGATNLDNFYTSLNPQDQELFRRKCFSTFGVLGDREYFDVPLKDSTNPCHPDEDLDEYTDRMVDWINGAPDPELDKYKTEYFQVEKIDSSAIDVNRIVSVLSANLTYEKHFDLSLKLLEQIEKTPKAQDELAQYHIGLALNYEQQHDIEKCNQHCEAAIALKHFGAYAYERLIKNYVKAKDWENALRVCDIALQSKDVLINHSWDVVSEYATKRKAYILKQIS